MMQILVNLISNAQNALNEIDRTDRTMTLIVAIDEDSACIQVRDNGVGIEHKNLTKLFTHGFTTRKEGHGFGLHSSALAAQELGGSLSVHSDGIGHGTTFTLRIPLKRETLCKV
jgi:signal transduction histidine kinase